MHWILINLLVASAVAALAYAGVFRTLKPRDRIAAFKRLTTAVVTITSSTAVATGAWTVAIQLVPGSNG